MSLPAEWLEPDGAGGFAFGTADGIRTRRYHALLLTQTAAGRFVLVNGIEAAIERDGVLTALSSQRYAPGVIHPDGATRITAFTTAPWPCWTFTLDDQSAVMQEVFVAGGQTSLRWTYAGPGAATLHIRPLLSGRDHHALHAENPAFDFSAETGQGWVRWRPYPGLPAITAFGGGWRADPLWFRQFLYMTERERGMDCTEDLASPGVLSWNLARPATLALRADAAPPWPVPLLAEAVAAERDPAPPLHRAALQYMAKRGDRSTILAGFPWFSDWGRDSFIALRGLLLAPMPPRDATPRERVAHEARTTARRDLAEQILLAWSHHVDRGMLPNRFPDGDGAPEFNAVDASLWFVIAVHSLLEAGVSPATAIQLQAACVAILEGYAQGTRYGIGADSDGLVRAGVPGVQLTWMDAKVGDWVVTPRIGKPVEVQALWINALRIAAAWPAGIRSVAARWAVLAEQATASFLARFPDPATGGLRDLVDGDQVEVARVRPNQIFAVGGLPHVLLSPALARGVVDLVETRLLTPLGLRTLDPADPAYCPYYRGDVRARDGAYHQGTVWPWLLGPFVEAWLRVRAGDASANKAAIRAEGRARFLPPLHAHLHEAGLGHVSEVADGDAPHTPGGCPFQAWSLGEFLRIEAMLAEPTAAKATA